MLPLFLHQQATFLWTNVEQPFILLDLVLDIVADLQLCLQIGQVASLVKEQTNRVFECLFVVGSGWNMDETLWKNGVFGVHKFVEKHSQRVSIISCVFAAWKLFELAMVKVRHIGSVLQTFLKGLVQGHCLSNLRDSVLKVDVFDVEHVEGDYRRGINELQRFYQTEENKLYMVFFQLYV